MLCAALTWCILATAPRASAQSSDLILCNGRLVRSLDFRNNTRISGAQNAVGSVYQYDDVGDGVDATIEILAELPETKIVAVSTLDDQFMKEKALNAGCSDYIIKPFNRNDLLKSLEKVLGVEL